MAIRPHVMLMHAGGLRSLVATAATLHRAEAVRLTLLHVHDGRDTAAIRLEHVRQQADHFGLTALHELDLGSLYAGAAAVDPDGRPHATLGHARLLLAALAHAADHRAAELVWPIAVNQDTAATARAHEQVLLTQQLLECDPPAADAGRLPGVTTPLLDLSDRQVVELGAGLGVPWDTARSCLTRSQRACGACVACRRRSAAFRAAGVVDHAAQAVAA
ncbi:MAG: 7-cyano-7-deazaguanine synthase [Planctomycetota bacterium]